MKQLLCTLALFSTLPAQADLTLHGHSMVWAMAMEGTGKETLQITKTRMRRDLIDRGRAYTQIVDIDRHEVTLIDHALRSAEVRAIASLSRQAERQLPGSVNVTDKNLRFELKATGAKRRLQDWTCGENRLLVSTPAEVGGEKVVLLDHWGDLLLLVWFGHPRTGVLRCLSQPGSAPPRPP